MYSVLGFPENGNIPTSSRTGIILEATFNNLLSQIDIKVKSRINVFGMIFYRMLHCPSEVPCYLKNVKDIDCAVVVDVCILVPVWITGLASESLCYDEYV